LPSLRFVAHFADVQGAQETVHNDDVVDATSIPTGQPTIPRSRSIAHKNVGYDVNVYSVRQSLSNPEQKER
jgi:hypothetical protein